MEGVSTLCSAGTVDAQPHAGERRQTQWGYRLAALGTAGDAVDDVGGWPGPCRPSSCTRDGSRPLHDLYFTCLIEDICHKDSYSPHGVTSALQLLQPHASAPHGRFPERNGSVTCTGTLNTV